MSLNNKSVIDPNSILGIDRVIHEPARMLILMILLSVENADFLFLLRQTGLTRGNLSSHMSKLEAAGFITVKKEFVEKIPRTLLSVRKDGKLAFNSYCKKMKEIIGHCQTE